MGRPIGVTLIAVGAFLIAALCVVFGIGMMVGGGFIATLINQQGGQGAGAGASIFAGLGVVVGVFALIFAAIYIMAGWGLVKLKSWGRILCIVLAAINALLQLLGLLLSLAHFTVGSFIWALFWLAVECLIIWYLLKPEVKAAFQGAQAGAASA